MKRLLLLASLTLFAVVDHGVAKTAGGSGAAGQFTGTEPEIVAVRARVVRVRVPAGFDRVTLQALTTRHGKGRAKVAGAAQPEWKTLGTKYPHGEEGVVEFHLARLTPKRNLRVYGNKNDALPESFLTGITTFLGDPAGATAGGVSVGAGGILGVTPAAKGANSFASADAGATEKRDVTEADIWKIVGDRLYFFNQVRGLQLFDLSKPADPALLGTLRMPAVGEDMYVLASGDAVLLKRATNWLWDDWFWWGGPIAIDTIGISPFAGVKAFGPTLASAPLTLTAGKVAADNAFVAIGPQQQGSRISEVLIADVSAGKPTILSRVPFDGTLRESRMVGNVLYVAADVFRPATDNVLATWGCEITSFDLADPANPVKRDSIHLGGWANAVMATDRFFFVAKWGDYVGGGAQNTVDVLDISSPNGAMQRGGQVTVPGDVADKFKMHQEDDTLTVISAGSRYEDAAGKPLEEWTPGARWTAFTTVSTFSLADFTAPVALGNLQIARGETVRATRFDNNRAYVVTFVQIDPLWIIDLQNPAAPTVLGQVDAPGFSTYIEPLGDRLVTIGLVRGQPAVTLFDVTDASHPTLLKQIVLDQPAGGYVWSDAVWNEKAFKVLPEENLILLPLSGYNADNGYASRVQLIDLFENTLVRRGVINANFYPRRATVHRDSIVSISPTKLVTVDDTDRDHPTVQAEIEIAWTTDRVFVVGDYLVQIDSGWSLSPSLTVTPASDPEQSLETQDLKIKKPVAGAAVREGVLYLAQVDDSGGHWDDTAQTWVADARELNVSTYDLSALPAIAFLGTTSVSEQPASDDWWGFGNLDPLWPSPTTLVWAGQGHFNSWWQPVWSDPPPYKNYEYVWKPDAGDVTNDPANVDDGAADAGDGSTEDPVDQTGSGQWVYQETGDMVDPPGSWYADWIYAESRRLYAFDVTDAKSPKYASTLEIGKGNPWDVAEPFAAEGSIYISYKNLGKVRDEADYRRSLDKFAQPDGFSTQPKDDLLNRHFLEVIDYDDPTKPIVDDTQANLPGRLVGLSRGGMLLYTMGQAYDVATGAALPDGTALHASAFDGSAVHLLDAIPLAGEGQPFVLSDETIFLLKPEPARIFKPSTDAAGNYWTGTWEDNPEKTSLATWTLTDAGKFIELDELALDHESNLSLFGGLAVAHGGASHGGIFLQWRWNRYGWIGGDSRTLHFVNATDAANLLDLGTYTFEGWIYPNLTFADGDETRGLWVPLGEYGVERVTLPK